jgi:hypothetical protein
MPARSESVQKKKKKKRSDYPLTNDEKKKFMETFKQIHLQIKDLEDIAFKASFRHI